MSESGDDELEEIRKRKAEQMKKQVQTPDGVVLVEDGEHFDQLVADHSPLLVDFYADWCGPCKLMEPTMEYLAEDSPATVAKVDVDEHQGLASEHGVQSVPTMLLFADGEEVDRFVGAKDEVTLLEAMEPYA